MLEHTPLRGKFRQAKSLKQTGSYSAHINTHVLANCNSKPSSDSEWQRDKLPMIALVKPLKEPRWNPYGALLEPLPGPDRTEKKTSKPKARNPRPKTSTPKSKPKTSTPNSKPYSRRAEAHEEAELSQSSEDGGEVGKK